MRDAVVGTDATKRRDAVTGAITSRRGIVMNIPAIMLAAPKSGSGKTTITCAMIKAFSDMGKKVRAFKCGPDYIDPMFHREVLGIPSENLDLYFVDEDYVAGLASQDNDSDITIIEGVMGLYDGLGGLTEEASSYHLACALDIPVILVIDAHGMGRSILAWVKGLLSMDRDKRIKGLILNRVSEHFYKELGPLIANETGIDVIGYFPDNKELKIESRYLGLTLPGEIDGIKEDLSRAADILAETVSIEKVIEIAGYSRLAGHNSQHIPTIDSSAKLRIAYAKDEAFCFYYEENLRILEGMGAEMVPFSPIHDDKLPDDISGLLLGGGYPEQYADKLTANVSMRDSIKAAIASGLPSVAECGGFMYLHDAIVTKEGIRYDMAGVIPGECRYAGHLVRFGYIELTDETGSFLEKKDSSIRGHEFHYYDSDSNGEDARAVKPVTNRSWKSSHISEDHWWGFGHLYYGSNTDFVKHFVEVCAGR